MTLHLVSELSVLIWNGVHNYMYPDPIGLIEWAELQIRMYAEMFRKQVFSSDVDEETVHECLETSHSLNKKVSCICRSIHS